MADEPFECWHEKARVTGKTIGTLRLHCPTCDLAVGVNPKWVGVVGSGRRLSPRTKAAAREER